MHKGKMALLVLTALLMALGASSVANNMMSRQLANQEQNISTGQVVVAATDIIYGQKIQKDHLIIKDMPKHVLSEDTFSRIEDVVGKIARGEIYQGETIVNKRLTSNSDGTILAALVNKSMRAVTVRVDDVIGVAGFLLPGNRVDVLASRMDNRRSETRTVLENIKVLAVDQNAQTKKETPLLVRAVTMEVSPKDSEKLFQAVQEGSIHLTLRNPIDNEKQGTPPETKTAIAKKTMTEPPVPKAKPVKKKKIKKPRKKVATQKPPEPVAQVVMLPPPKPVPTKTITVIRGMARDQITITNNKVP